MSTKNFSREPGAPGADGMIPLSVPEIRGNEWAYVKECLDTNFVSSVGQFVNRFERELALRIGAPHAVATVNGTAALHVALLIAGVEADDEVLVSTLTFIAPVNAIRYANAWPVFVDAEPRYWEMDVDKVRDFLVHRCRRDENGAVRNLETGRRVRAILPVHILGHPVDMDPLLDLTREFGLVVIEDATESLGSRYKGRECGTIGDIGCFSFNGNKLITTGGGGMIVTANEAMAKRARYLTTQAKDDPIEFVHGAVGFNYRMTNIAAALGVAQLELMDSYIARKLEIAKRYEAFFAEIDGITPMPAASWSTPNRWLYTVLVDESRFGMDSRALLAFLEERNIQTRPLWQPIHLSPAHVGAQKTDCSVAESLNRRALSLPCSVGLTHEQQELVLTTITEAVPAARP
jgi:perosamine synthetase